MDQFIVTPAVLAAIAGAVLSLAFSYIPGLNAKFAALPSENKSLIMAVMLLLASLAVYGLGCAGIVQSGIGCDQKGAVQLAFIFISAIMANQSVYALSAPTQAVKDVKAKTQ